MGVRKKAVNIWYAGVEAITKMLEQSFTDVMKSNGFSNSVVDPCIHVRDTDMLSICT